MQCRYSPLYHDKQNPGLVGRWIQWRNLPHRVNYLSRYIHYHAIYAAYHFAYQDCAATWLMLLLLCYHSKWEGCPLERWAFRSCDLLLLQHPITLCLSTRWAFWMFYLRLSLWHFLANSILPIWGWIRLHVRAPNFGERYFACHARCVLEVPVTYAIGGPRVKDLGSTLPCKWICDRTWSQSCKWKFLSRIKFIIPQWNVIIISYYISLIDIFKNILSFMALRQGCCEH